MNLRYHINYDEVRAKKVKDSPKNITDLEVSKTNSEWSTIIITTEMAKLSQKWFNEKKKVVQKEKKIRWADTQLIRKVMKITSLTNISSKEKWWKDESM